MQFGLRGNEGINAKVYSAFMAVQCEFVIYRKRRVAPFRNRRKFKLQLWSYEEVKGPGPGPRPGSCRNAKVRRRVWHTTAPLNRIFNFIVTPGPEALSFVTKDTSHTHRRRKRVRLRLPSQNEATRIFRGLATNLNSEHAAAKAPKASSTYLHIPRASFYFIFYFLCTQSHFILQKKTRNKTKWNEKFYTFLIWKPFCDAFFTSLLFSRFAGCFWTTKPRMIKTIKR